MMLEKKEQFIHHGSEYCKCHSCQMKKLYNQEVQDNCMKKKTEKTKYLALK